MCTDLGWPGPGAAIGRCPVRMAQPPVPKHNLILHCFITVTSRSHRCLRRCWHVPSYPPGAVTLSPFFEERVRTVDGDVKMVGLR